MFSLRLFLCSSLALLAFSAYGQSIDSLILKAQHFDAAQKYSESLSHYSTCLELDADMLPCQLGIATASMRLGDFSRAKIQYEKILEKDSLNTSSIVALSSIYDQELNSAKASKYYKLLNEIYPDNAVYYRKHGNQYFRTGYINDAYHLYQQAWELNPRDILTIKSMAEIHIAQGEYLESDSLLQIAFTLDSNNVSVLLLKAKNSYRLKNYEDAVVSLKKVNRATNLDNYFKKMLGYSFMQTDSLDKAIFWLQQSLENENNPEYAHYYLAKAYEAQDNEEFAIHHYDLAIASGISKNMATYHMNVGKIYEDQKDLKKAVKHYEKANTFGAEPIVLYQLALAYDVLYADKSVAVRYFDKYLKSGDDNIVFLEYALKRRDYLIEIAHLRK